MVGNIIETFDLSKIYKLRKHRKEILALNKINLKIKEGEFFGLLGPNGAGKTTIVQILTTLIQPSSGYALIDGINVLKNSKEVKKKIGLMLGSGMIYNRISGYDNLKIFCKIYNIPDHKKRIINIAEEMGLEKWLDQYVEKYSLGMKIKLAMCRAFLIDPKILFLDEPTLGLDIKATQFVIDKLKDLNKTIFLTSHNMYVVEQLCNRIAFINHGEILKIGSQMELKELMKHEIEIHIEMTEKKLELNNELNQLNFINKIIDSNKGLIITLNNRKDYHDLLLVLGKYKSIKKIHEPEISLENLFLKFV